MNPLFGTENLRRIEPLLQTLRDVATEVDAKPAQVALAWLISLPGVVAIPGASSVEQLEFNVAAADIELRTGSRDALTEAARAFRPVSSGRASSPNWSGRGSSVADLAGGGYDGAASTNAAGLAGAPRATTTGIDVDASVRRIVCTTSMRSSTGISLPGMQPRDDHSGTAFIARSISQPTFIPVCAVAFAARALADDQVGEADVGVFGPPRLHETLERRLADAIRAEARPGRAEGARVGGEVDRLARRRGQVRHRRRRHQRRADDIGVEDAPPRFGVGIDHADERPDGRRVDEVVDAAKCVGGLVDRPIGRMPRR